MQLLIVLNTIHKLAVIFISLCFAQHQASPLYIQLPAGSRNTDAPTYNNWIAVSNILEALLFETYLNPLVFGSPSAPTAARHHDSSSTTPGALDLATSPSRHPTSARTPGRACGPSEERMGQHGDEEGPVAADQRGGAPPEEARGGRSRRKGAFPSTTRRQLKHHVFTQRQPR